MKTKSPVFGSLLGTMLVLSAASAVCADQIELSSDIEGRYYATMPQEGENTITVPADAKIIQIGTGSQVTNSSVTLTAPEGKTLQIIEGDFGSLSTEYYNGFSGQDSLFIYNGANASAPEIFKASRGTALGTLSTTGPDLTIRYKEVEQKISWYSSFRLDLIVFVVDPNALHNIEVDEYAASNGSVTVQSSATANTLVQVEAVPNEGYVLEGFVVRTTDEWYSIATTENVLFAGNEATFIMPGTNVTVEPIFVSTADLQSGLTLNTPGGRALRVNIPSGVESFNINGGGMDNELNKPMILKAPDGYLFYLEDGSAQYGNRTGIFAYDGDNEDAYRTRMEPMAGKVSAGSDLTLVYVSIGDQYERTIRLIEANATHSVEVYHKGNGYVDDGLSSASTGNTINLTATPDEGYMIAGVYAEAYFDGDSWSVPITGGTWYTGNDYSFTMPYADVRVNVEFVEKATTADDGLYIQMPQRDSVVATIPADVESFMVTGSCGGNDACKGTLVLAAPEGFKFQLSGSVGIYDASMTIFDGSIANALNQLELTQKQDVELNSSGDTLTLRYQSMNSYLWADLRITMFNPNKKYNVTMYDEIENGTVLPDLEEAAAGDTVTLTANPDEGYFLEWLGVYWTDKEESEQYGYIIGGTWDNNEAKFVMPSADVVVEAYFSKPEKGEFFTYIPKEGSLSLDIPSTMSWMNVYSENDEDGDYFNNSDGVLELTAPEGYVIGVKGSVNANDDGDVLTIYDGAGENAEIIRTLSNGSFEEIYSSGRSMSFRFQTNASGVAGGPDLYIAVLKKPEISVVTIREFSNGFKMASINGSYSGEDAVNIPNDIDVDGFEFVREYTPDAYSTITLPFDFDANRSWGFKEILEFAGIVVEDGKKKVGMRRVWCLDWVDEECSSLDGKLKAYTPYVFNAMYSSAYFYGEPITLKKTEDAVSSVGDWEFRGTLVRKTWQEGDPDLGKVYGFSGVQAESIDIGQFVKIGKGTFVRPLRAYLMYAPVNGQKARVYKPSMMSQGEMDIPEKMEVVIISSINKPESEDGSTVDNGEKTTTIGYINTRTGEFKPATTYDLKGRKMNGTPKAKGMYLKRK